MSPFGFILFCLLNYCLSVRQGFTAYVQLTWILLWIQTHHPPVFQLLRLQMCASLPSSLYIVQERCISKSCYYYDRVPDGRQLRGGGKGLCIGSQFKGCGQSWWRHGYRWVCGSGRMDAIGCVLLTSRWIRKRRDSLLLVQPHILKVPPSLQTAPAFRDHIVRPRQDIFHSKLKRRWQEIGSCYEDLLLKMLILTNCTPGSSRGCQSNSHECDRLVWQDTGWPSSSELGTLYNPHPHPCTHTFIHTHMLRASYSHPIQVNLEL